MRIFVLGGTGQIGAAVVRALLDAGHEVLGLARSEVSAAALRAAGAEALPGDLRDPEGWLGALPEVDAVIQAAADFSDEMGAVETRLLDRLLPRLARRPGRLRFLYTGGCWLYGATGATAAREAHPFDPLPAFAWMLPNLRRVLAGGEVAGLAVHPALVYDRRGGVLRPFVEDAREGGAVRVIGGADLRWPLVEAGDLGRLYALALARGRVGESYNAAGIAGRRVGDLAAAVARRFGPPGCGLRVVTAEAAAARLGEWARGFALDQRMSAAKARRELGWRPASRDPVAELEP